MAMLRKIALIMVVFAAFQGVCASPAFAGTDREEGSKAFIDGMAQQAIDFLGDQNLTMDQRKAQFRNLLNNSFDMDTIGRFALGRYWREATDGQRKEYLKLFHQMVIEVYSQRFSEYKGQKVEVRSAREDGETDAIVASYIVPADSGSEIQVDWRVRHEGGKYKIVDVIVEGVSMSVTQRSDFASVIQRGGGQIDVLLAHLRGGGSAPLAEAAQ